MEQHNSDTRPWWRLRPEVIGEPECPVLHRWTFGSDRLVGRWPVKLMLHHFLPNADDRHVHDHPRPFLTFVLRGGYDDMGTCAVCAGNGWLWGDDGDQGLSYHCVQCAGVGLVQQDRLTAGSIRYRRARHSHRTQVHKTGCWTLVVMGPKVRAWGFWKDGRWIPWRIYHKRFGGTFRCDGDR